MQDIDRGIAQAEAAGLRLRSRIASEEAGFGKHVVQAQFASEETFGFGVELVERQIPGDPHVPLTRRVAGVIVKLAERQSLSPSERAPGPAG